MSRTLHLFGTDWCAMMVPIHALQWYRMQCYDGTDSCATVVPIRRYCQFREDNKDSLTSVRNKIDAHRDEDVCMQIETAENLHLSDAVKLILDYGRIVNELGTVVSPMKQLGILRLESVFHDRNR